MDVWQEEGQIIFSCLLCFFCSVNQLFSSESKNLFQDVNKSKVIRKGNVIPLRCSSLTHISKWKLFKDTTWHRLIGDESFGTWSWKCLLKWVALWLFAWVTLECSCMLQDQGGEGSVLQGPELSIAERLLSWPAGLSGKMPVLRVNCFIGSQPVWSVSPRTKLWILKFKWNRNITRLLWLINLIWNKRNN